MTIAHLLKRAGFDEDVEEVIGREGKIGVTTDLASDRRGGATQAGISQAYFGKNPDGSWKRSKEQIAAMTPGEIKAVYRDIYKVPDKFTDPRVRKVMFDMTTNAGPTANGILQRSVNGLLPTAKRLKVDNIAGSGTLAAAKGVDQGRLAGKLLDGYSAHHTRLIKERPDLYAENVNGWRNRVNGLRNTIGAMKALPAPVVVKGTLQPQPVMVKGHLQTPAPSRPTPTTQPGGPIRSMPMLSAPATQVMSKQAMRPIAERMQRLRDRHTCGKPNRDGAMCDCGEPKAWSKEASRAKEIQELLNDSDIQSDIYFFTDGKERATVCIGDWHEKTEAAIAYQFGMANWDNFEKPDDTEISKPSWATMTLHPRRKGLSKQASIATLLRQARNATHALLRL